MAAPVAGALALAAAHASAVAQALPSQPESPASVRVLTLDVTLNGAKAGIWPLVERDGQLHAPVEAVESWRLQLPPGVVPFVFRGVPYLPLQSAPGFSARIDPSLQSVDLGFAPSAFSSTRLQGEAVARTPTSAVVPAAFVNYDLSVTTAHARASGTQRDAGLLTEAGFSNAWGVFTSSQVARSVSDSISARGLHLVRMESTFTRNWPDSNLTLRMGDTATRAPSWGRSAYFGGVQWGRNFALTPGFVSQPTPVLAGLSTAPSTVELYVNDVLRQVSSVPAGPFAIENLPAITGGGEARIVVRDLLGRETVITQPFFTSAQLLAPGLDDWSVEAGRLRRDLGVASNRYADGFASGLWRHGASERITWEAHAQAGAAGHGAGAGVVAALPAQVLGSASLAYSGTPGVGTGRQWQGALEHQGLEFGAFVQAQGASIGYRQLGQERDAVPLRRQLAGNFSYTSARWGTVGLGFAGLTRYGDSSIRTLSANYTRRLGERATIALQASRASGTSHGSSFSATLTVPLDGRVTLQTAFVSRPGRPDLYEAANYNPGFDGTIGWRALAGRVAGESHAEAGAYYMGSLGRVSADLSATSSQETLRVGSAGGIVVADGHWLAGRRVEGSMALVSVPGYAGVEVGVGGGIKATTDASGVAFVSGLQPYTANPVRIDPAGLPFSAEIGSIEQTVAPAWRSAARVDFAVRSGRGALLRIVLDDGQPAPAGAIVRLDGDDEAFYVARRGEAFVTGLATDNEVTLTHAGRSCRLKFSLPPVLADDIPRVGPITCRGLAP